MQIRVLKMLVIAALLAFTSSTRCWAETRAHDTKVAAAKVAAAKTTVKRVKVDLSSPEKTVRTFVAAINAQDIDAMIACVYGAKPLKGKDGAAFRAMVEKDAAHAPSGNLAIGEIKMFVDVKPIRFETVCRFQSGGETIVAPSVLEMTRADDGWKIIPLSEAKRQEAMNKLQATEQQNQDEADEKTSVQTKPQPDVLLLTASMLAQMVQDTRASVEGALREKCVSNLRQVALGAMMFSQENDEAFAFTQSDFVTKLNTFARDESIFFDPKTNSVFGLNSQLANIELSKIQSPAETVLFYTGANGVLDFNYYDGTAVVAFADGHVKSVTREYAKTLRWNS